MNVLCTVGQRNEAVFLEPWVRYHAYMVGVENIHIIDNASDNPAVLKKLDEYEKLGIGITRIPPGAHLEQRGSLTASVIQKLEAERRYDFVFPMDCDEFLSVFNSEGKTTCCRHDIMKYLHGLKSREGVYRIIGGLMNVNKVPGKFIWRQHYSKVFFSAQQCLDIDTGYHVGIARNGLPALDTKMIYVHFHVKPYPVFKPAARQLLEGFVDVNNIEALKRHTGPNCHVARLFTLDEEGYDAHFAAVRERDQHLEQEAPEFARLMRVLGLNPNVF